MSDADFPYPADIDPELGRHGSLADRLKREGKWPPTPVSGVENLEPLCNLLDSRCSIGPDMSKGNVMENEDSFLRAFKIVEQHLDDIKQVISWAESGYKSERLTAEEAKFAVRKVYFPALKELLNLGKSL